MANNRRKKRKAKQKAAVNNESQQNTPKADNSAKHQMNPSRQQLQEIYTSLPLPFIGVLLPRVFTQTENAVTISLGVRGIQDHPMSDIEIVFRSLSLEVNVKNFCGGHLVSRIYQLHGSINKKASSFKIVKDKIILELIKDPPKFWSSLHQCPFIQYDLFLRKMVDAYKACKVCTLEIVDICNFAWSEALAYCEAGLSSRSYALSHGIRIFEKDESSFAYSETINMIEAEVKKNSNNKLLWAVLGVYNLDLIRQKFEEVPPDYPDVAVEMENEDDVFTENHITDVTDSSKGRRREKITDISDEKFREEIRLYNEAISQNPLCSSNYLKRSKLYFKHFNIMKSRQDLLKYAELKPFAVEVYVHLARSFIATYEGDNAASCYRFARILGPYRGKMRHQIDHLSVFLRDITLLKLSVEKGELKQAMNHLRKALKNFYFTPCSVRKVIEFLCQEKKLKSVKTIIDGLNKCDFSEEQVYECEITYFQSLLACYEEDEDSFNSLFKKYLALRPTDWEALEKYECLNTTYFLRKKGDTYLEGGKIPEAVKQDPQEQNLRPNSAVTSAALVKMAETKLKQGLVDEVIADMTLAISKNKDSHEFYAKRGKAYLANQRFNNAQKDFRKAISLFPCDLYKLLVHKSISEKHKAKKIQKATLLVPELDKETIKTESSKQESVAVSFHNEKSPPVVPSSAQEVNSETGFRGEEVISGDIPKENLSKDGASLLANAKRLIALGSPQKAIKILNKARKQCYEKDQVLKCYQESLFLIMKLKFGEEAMEQRDFERALEKFDSASKIAIFDSSIWVKRAECLLSLHRVTEVRELIASIPSEIETESNIFYMKGLYEHHLGNFEASIDLLSDALTKDPQNKKAKARLALIKFIYEKVKETES